MSVGTGMIIFFIILAIAALFVMSEFVLVRIRPTRLDFLIENGNKNAILLKKMTKHLDTYLSATQLGVTITSLALGWLGDPTFKKLFDTLFSTIDMPSSVSSILSIIVSFSLLTFVQVIVGELVPKNFAINKTEKIGLLIARPLQVWYRLMYPIVFVLNGVANGISRSFGLKSVSESDESVSEEELRIIMSESLKSGEINRDEYQFVENVFAFDNRMSREIMVPRTEMVTVSTEMSLKEISELVRTERYTRYPVIENGDKDSVIGVINTKEIFAAYVNYVEAGISEKFNINKYIRPVISVIETIPIKEILVKMQKERNQVAILVDEYGGTSGMISIEDIVEEIVGDINDDYETSEEAEIRKIDDHHYIVSARMLIDEINELFGLSIEEDNVDTIGGWMMNEKYDIQEGDSLVSGDYVFTVIKSAKSTIETIEISHKELEEPLTEVEEESTEA
ncbi:HlyC/CorC family transporter [Carnobacterium divergens]|uniref:HlyC/CorC family transporter n=1 Tax=Carnobacterium divergens TaxID=2748 RepID=A0A5F0MEP0_CARDV|nr:HlyC/CorC family transporter [Carnobacterium divergens]TFI72279.1 HlyC/CorC family transporter [Carnobacterium divergens]TFI72514.1 HlyC/CorC family transporter [Carnobacterium divergens]TFI76812.1 HlyC/CorC family transporter [Carnobacterium divergens]TFI83244.1 HlyC/CorC family transporter [Carnobacterium divergens]